MPDSGDDRALTLAAAARRLSVDVRTVRRLINRGELRATKIGRVWRIRESEVERLLGPRGGADD